MNVVLQNFTNISTLVEIVQNVSTPKCCSARIWAANC